MQKLRIHYLQHVHFEGLGSIENWIKENNHTLTSTKFFNDEPLPEISEFDWLIIMGGPMGVNDEDIYPWLNYEKTFIKKAIDSGKTVLGICLGAQLIANVLGAKVYQNKYKEIGWFDVHLTDTGLKSKLFNAFDNKMMVFHWHGDTFDLPDGAQNLLRSEACEHQCFLFKEKVLGLQFHFEIMEENLKEMIFYGKNELITEKYIQSEQEILDQSSLIKENNNLMNKLLYSFC
jgi:GMP synthase-like glutamine amidotransferase